MLRAAESLKSAAGSLPSLSYVAAPPHVSSRPPIPHHLERIQLQENAKIVLEKRYLRRGESGAPVEGIDEMFWRVAWHVGIGQPHLAEEFYRLMTSKRFFPNSPTFTGAGTPLGQLAACFVVPISDDMGRASDGIFQTLRDATLIQQTGGGNGFSFSRLRHKGAFVRTSGGTSSGPVGFLEVYDHAFGKVAQGGCLLPDTLVFTSNGLLRLDEIVPSGLSAKQWNPHVLSVPTDEGVKDSRAAYNNGVVPCLRIQTKEGYDIAGTLNHRVKRFNEATGKIEWVRFDEVTAGDRLVLLADQHQDTASAVKLVVPKPKDRQHPNVVIPERYPKTLGEEFAFLLGYIAGNGCMDTKRNRLGIAVPHKSAWLMHEIPDLVHRLFGDNINVSEHQQENNKSVTFVITNTWIVNFFDANGLRKKKSHEVSMPSAVRKSPRSILAAYLRGLFEADASVRRGRPSYETVSLQMAKEVQAALTGLGCVSKLRVIDNEKRAEQGSRCWGTKPGYVVTVASSRGLDAWKRNIGSPHPLSRFQECMTVELGPAQRNDEIPGASFWLREAYAASTGDLRKKLRRFVVGDSRLTHAALRRLGLCDVISVIGNRYFVTVSSVEDIGEQPTLDIEVDDNHTYLANGFISHNTRRVRNRGQKRAHSY